MGKRYNIGFKGEVAAGYTLGDVRSGFAMQFKKNDDVLERLFSGNACTLGKGMDLAEAHNAVERLRSIGAVVYLLDDEGRIVRESPSESANDAEIGMQPATDSEDLAGYDLTDTAKFRHLQQITNQKFLAPSQPVDQRKMRLRYQFDTFMAKGGISIFKALTLVFVLTFLVIGALRGAMLLAFPEISQQHSDIGFFGNLYITFLEITDPGSMTQDIYSSIAYKAFAVLAGLAGIVMLSALIAFITTSMDQKISDLKRGRSRVIENGHTLILGWNEQRVIETLRELVSAKENEKRPCVVILAEQDKEAMDEVLRSRLRDTGRTRVVTRTGDVSTMTNLEMVSLESCRAVVILASCDDTDSAERKSASDAKAIQTVLATMGNKIDDDEFNVIVEIFNPTHRDIVRSTFPDHVVTINTSDILAKLLVQTSRSVGLSVVYNEILSFNGCELYFFDAEWASRTFGEASFHFPDGVPMGIRDVDGKIHLNPSPDRALAPDDEILILADDRSTIEFRERAVAEPKDYVLAGRRLEKQVENELMIGWTLKSPAIIRKFADYVTAGSRIQVLLKNPTPAQRVEIDALNEELGSIHVGLLQKDCLNIDDLLSVKPFEFDNIIILAGNSTGDASFDAARIDSENIVAMLLLRRIFSQFPVESSNTKLITEILDSQNDALVAKAGVHDVIISNRLVSMIMAQVSESRDLEKVYADLFQDDGSEIYLKPAHLYFDDFPLELTFADLMAIAQKRDEACFGVKLKAFENDRERHNGVSLIPGKSTKFRLTADDSLIVLAKDEL